MSISPNSAQTKNIGETFTITPTVGPSNANNKNVNWTSSNTSVATVSKAATASGTAITVTCKAAGTATITATAADGSEKSANLVLIVYEKVNITSFSYSSNTIYAGQITSVPIKTTTGTAKFGPTYTSSDTNVATVSSDGKITGISAGITSITISYINYDGTISTRTYDIIVVNYTIVINAQNTTITCRSPYVKSIALPSTSNHSYFGMTSTEKTGIQAFIQFTESILEAKCSSSKTEMPNIATSDVANNNSGASCHYYENALLHSILAKFAIFEITLDSGNKVTLKFTRNASSESSPFIELEIF